MIQGYCVHCDSIMSRGKCVNLCGGNPRAVEQIKAIREDRISSHTTFQSIGDSFDKKLLDQVDKFVEDHPELKEPKMPKVAARFNEDKPRLSYFRRSFRKMVEGIAWVKTFGANKYEDDNWRIGGKPDTEYWDSMDRHIDLFLEGEAFDQDSGCHHLAHACWNLCALLELNYPDAKMRDVDIFTERMAYWAAKKADKNAEKESPLVPEGWGEGLKEVLEEDSVLVKGTKPSERKVKGTTPKGFHYYENARHASTYTGIPEEGIIGCCEDTNGNNELGGIKWAFNDEVSE